MTPDVQCLLAEAIQLAPHPVEVELAPRLAHIGDRDHILQLIALHLLVRRGSRLVGCQRPAVSEQKTSCATS